MRTPIAITTSVLEDLHNDGASQWIVTTVAYNDGTMWRHSEQDNVWRQLPAAPYMQPSATIAPTNWLGIPSL